MCVRARAQGSITGKDAALTKAESRLAALCTPPNSEEGDEIKKQQASPTASKECLPLDKMFF